MKVEAVMGALNAWEACEHSLLQRLRKATHMSGRF
jgi:hypothetical protein